MVGGHDHCPYDAVLICFVSETVGVAAVEAQPGQTLAYSDKEDDGFLETDLGADPEESRHQ